LSSIKITEGKYMPKTMTKYQLDHFKEKVRRNFDPLIEEQELLVKQYRAEATEKIVGKLAKKMGADKILDEFKKAEAQLKAVRDKARTFFKKKQQQDPDKKSLTYTMRNRDEEITLKDCEEQMRDWARELVDREIRRRPEGLKLKQLEELKQHSIDTVMESGTPEDLLVALDKTTKKIGIAWVVDTSKIKQISAN
jgi:asparagine synthetase B (glutamine-hydrolysing)